MLLGSHRGEVTSVFCADHAQVHKWRYTVQMAEIAKTIPGYYKNNRHFQRFIETKVLVSHLRNRPWRPIRL
jgi:hypothetical protein